MDSFLSWYIDLIQQAESKIHQLEEHYGLRKNCTKGCDDCCYQQIDLYRYELFSISHYLKQNNLMHLVNSKVRPPTMSDKYHYYLHRRPCMFLKNGICIIHEVRPISCLNYFSQNECSPINKILYPDLTYSYHEIEDYITTQVAFFMEKNPSRYPLEFYKGDVIKLSDYIEGFI